MIVTNTTFRMCPWAEVLFAFDPQWWREHGAEVARNFRGDTVTASAMPPKLDVKTFYKCTWFDHFGNSGAAAISLAILGGARQVVMLGYDCQKTGGKTHWHGDHPATLGNAVSMKYWPAKFEKLAKHAARQRVKVVNASRQTALTCFPRVDLREALAQGGKDAG